MLAVSIILLILIAAGAFALSRRNRNSLGESQEPQLSAPTNFAGLFDTVDAAQSAAQEQALRQSQRRADLLARARQFDLQTLDDAHTESMLYHEVLNELISQSTDSQDKLHRLVGHLSKSQELKGNVRLAEMMMEAWKDSPDNRSTARMLHFAALSEDAALLQRAIELTFEGWQKGWLPNLSAKDFLALAESEYWVLAPEARRSGAGFILKNRLVALRRTLAATLRG